MSQSPSLFISDHYGSKSGFARYYQAKIAGLFGCWKQYQALDYDKVKRLVFVCNGNICRSPLAEAVARNSGYPALSFGLECTRGAGADQRAIDFAKNSGLDLGEHRARPVIDIEWKAGDLLVVMEPMQLSSLESIPPGVEIQKTCLGLWHQVPSAYIHDPFNSNDEYFSRCLEMVKTATENLVNTLKRA